MDYWCDHCETAQETENCAISGADLAPASREPIPWMWRFFIVATVVYVIWRIYQLVTWLSH
jgi:hypothetical protein